LTSSPEHHKFLERLRDNLATLPQPILVGIGTTFLGESLG